MMQLVSAYFTSSWTRTYRDHHSGVSRTVTERMVPLKRAMRRRGRVHEEDGERRKADDVEGCSCRALMSCRKATSLTDAAGSPKLIL